MGVSGSRDRRTTIPGCPAAVVAATGKALRCIESVAGATRCRSCAIGVREQPRMSYPATLRRPWRPCRSCSIPGHGDNRGWLSYDLDLVFTPAGERPGQGGAVRVLNVAAHRNAQSYT